MAKLNLLAAAAAKVLGKSQAPVGAVASNTPTPAPVVKIGKYHKGKSKKWRKPKTLRQVYALIQAAKVKHGGGIYAHPYGAVAMANLQAPELEALGIPGKVRPVMLADEIGKRLDAFALLDVSPLGGRLKQAWQSGKLRLWSKWPNPKLNFQWPKMGEIPLLAKEDLKDPEVLVINVDVPRDRGTDDQVITLRDVQEAIVLELVNKATRDDVIALLNLHGERAALGPALQDSWLVKGTRENVTFTVTEDSFKWGETEIVRHAYVAGQFFSADLGDDPWGWVFLMLWQALCHKWKRKGIGAFLRDHPSMWQEDIREGQSATDIREIMRKNKIFCLAPKFGQGLVLGVAKDKGLCHEAGTAALKRGLPAAWHHQLEWVVAGAGAEAVGVGIDPSTGHVRVMAESNTLTKVLTRAKAAFTNATLMLGAEDSGIGYQTRDGVSRNKGLRFQAAIVESPFANEGDGMAFLLNGREIAISGQKSFELQVESFCGLEGKAAEAEVTRRIKGSRKTPSYGDAVVLLDDVVQHTWRLLVPGQLSSASADWDPTTQKVNVKFTYRWEDVSPKGKLTTLGWKCMVMPKTPGSMFFKGMKDVELVTGPNGIKGEDAKRSMWAAARGGVVVNPNIGYTPAQVADYQAWEKANTHTQWVKFVVACPEALAELKAANPESADLRYLDHGVVYHRCPVTTGPVVLTVESTSVVEAAGDTRLFSETLFGRAAALPEWAQETWNKRGKRVMQAYQEGFRAARGEFDTEVDLAAVRLAGLSRDLGKTQRDVIEALAEMYPGVTRLVFGQKAVCVSFAALLHLDTWMPGGTTNGASRFAVALAKAPESFTPDWLQDQLAGLGNLLGYTFREGSAMKAPLRVGKLLQRKVVTSWACPRGRVLLNAKDPQVLSGEFRRKSPRASQRNPMISCVYGRTELNNLVPVGLILMNPLDWVTGNNGDTDGDVAISSEVPQKFARQAKKVWGTGHLLAGSMFGPNGYAASTSGHWPYVKAMFAPKVIQSAEGYTGTVFTVEDYAKTVGEIGKHYRINVGVGYAIASRALYRYLLLQEQNKATFEEARFVAWAWRIFYEDFGLAGWSEDNALVYQVVYNLVMNPEISDADAVQGLVDHFSGTEAPITTQMGETLLKLYRQYEIGKAIEKGEMGQTDSPLHASAAGYTLIRRASKGKLASFDLEPKIANAFKGLLGEYLKSAMVLQAGFKASQPVADDQP